MCRVAHRDVAVVLDPCGVELLLGRREFGWAWIGRPSRTRIPVALTDATDGRSRPRICALPRQRDLDRDLPGQRVSVEPLISP